MGPHELYTVLYGGRCCGLRTRHVFLFLLLDIVEDTTRCSLPCSIIFVIEVEESFSFNCSRFYNNAVFPNYFGVVDGKYIV